MNIEDVKIFIEDYFRKKTEEIDFIEIKDGNNFTLGDTVLDSTIPLPVLRDDFLTAIKDGSVEDEINIEHIINGMINIIGADDDFPYNEKYVEVLKAYNDNIEDYILYLGIKDLENNKIRDAGIKFRSILYIDKNNIKGIFNYALVLELISVELQREEKLATSEGVLLYGTKLFEKLLDLDEDFALSYYKLGFHYKNTGQFLKASLIWEKFLEKSKDDILSQEIRGELEIIEDDKNMETGWTYLLNGKYELALKYFTKLLPKHENQWNINLLLGQTYKGLEDYNMAIGYFKRAINLSPNESDSYNELAIAYFDLGDLDEATNVLDEGIENNREDYRLFYNRGIINIENGNKEDGITDIMMAIELNPEDESLKQILEQIEKQ